MTGPEVSVFAVCDGTRAVLLAAGPGLQARRRRRHRARTPAAWARTRRCRGCPTGFVDDVRRPVRRADAGRAAPARHRLPRRPLRRADAHAGGPEARSSTTSASATPTARSCCSGSPPTSAALLGRGGRRRARATDPTVRRRRRRAGGGRRRGLPDRRRARATPSTGSTRRPAVDGVDRALRRRGSRRRGRLVTAGGRVLDVVGHGAGPGRRPGPAPTTRSATSPGLVCTIAPTSPERSPRHDVQGRHPHGLAQRHGQDAARRRHPRAVRHRGRRAGAPPPTATRPWSPALASRRPRGGLRAPSSAAPAWPPTWPAWSPPTRPCPWSACRCPAARSTASTRCTPRSRCPRASRWPPSPSTAR